uniref:Uncharacterized protein n=1 Tax=Pongo abelii TaxID=9601 RepID=H2NRE7_PONAB
ISHQDLSCLLPIAAVLPLSGMYTRTHILYARSFSRSSLQNGKPGEGKLMPIGCWERKQMRLTFTYLYLVPTPVIHKVIFGPKYLVILPIG